MKAGPDAITVIDSLAVEAAFFSTTKIEAAGVVPVIDFVAVEAVEESLPSVVPANGEAVPEAT
jgi:hypothetical protein